ncbi:methylated-DNA--protein-cysteine methyltransferase isoform X1 [Salmo salar]|uniref:Methylated-DNA--protein-cysteine methyltransferase n=2 Tax=Salmo salar TaxID=8030 RepID=A0A1S3N3G9_SALSA|nr:methylated-DNA--protein-cysteine methyltransferase isoform X1 [Salmo salar]XP_014009937.2 methylated-DNA--protein-cysteine methyltransferase isoform X1 [Salmo salar]XP_014009938.2 methylated-DNA--protein-cysteine methyltransferase isoform X1 [Salmo salar]XP_045556376.1 methylated-DNA--protein-cysteine methyltransferase isoform X1 [Salmo salar]
MEQGNDMKSPSQCRQRTISLQSPLGKIQVSGCENGVHTIQILMDVPPAVRSDDASLSCVVTASNSQEEMGPELQHCVEWLRAYFSEPWAVGRLPLPVFHHPTLHGDAFTSRVLQTLVRDVKVGETVSYKRLAEMAGNPRAVRAVGGAMRRNPVPLLIPCHRVISSSGQSGMYMGGKGNHLKQWLLTHEKVKEED